MAECQMITHEIARGDTLYRLAQKYKTTVPLILLANPGIDPYNLQVGTRLNICKGNQFTEKPSMDEIQMMGDFNKIMLQYVNWVKMYLVSLFQSAVRQREVSQKTEQTAGKLVDIFGIFYPDAMTSMLRDRLVREYTRDLMAYANAVKNGDRQAADQYEERLEDQAEALAKLLAQYNRNYDEDRLEEWLEELPETVEAIVIGGQKADYMGEFNGYDRLDELAMQIAMFLSDGIRKEFYR